MKPVPSSAVPTRSSLVNGDPVTSNRPRPELVSPRLLHFPPFPYASGELQHCDLGIFRSHCLLPLLLRLIFNKHSKTKKKKCLVSMGKSSTKKMRIFCAHREFDLSFLRTGWDWHRRESGNKGNLAAWTQKISNTFTSTGGKYIWQKLLLEPITLLTPACALDYAMASTWAQGPGARVDITCIHV